MAVQQQETICRYFGTGSLKVFPYTFRLLDTNQLKVFVDNVEKAVGADFTVSNVGQLSGGNITFAIAPANGASVVFTRVSTLQRTIDYMDGGVISGEILDYDQDYQTQLIQEIASRAILIDEQYRVNAKGARITNVGDAINPDDVVTKGYADTILDATQYLASEALVSAGQASSSATAAGDFADDAEASAIAAAASASTAASAGASAGAAAAISAVAPYVTQAEDAADAASASATQALGYSNSASISATAASGSASAALSSANAAASSLAAMTPPGRSSELTSTNNVIEFAIPAGAKSVTIHTLGLSMANATDMYVQLGTAGEWLQTGYMTHHFNIITTSTYVASETTTHGWLLAKHDATNQFSSGTMRLFFASGDIWSGDGIAISSGPRQSTCTGFIFLSAPLTRVRLIAASGNFTGSGFAFAEWSFW